MPFSSSRALGARGEVDERVEQQPDAEVGQRRPEEGRRQLAPQEQLLVVAGADALEQVQLLDRVRPGRALLAGGPLGRDDLLGGLGGAAGDAGEAHELVAPAVDHPAEVAGDADRPRDRRGGDADLRLDLVEQLERVAPGPVPLVDEGEQRQTARPAHLEQLERLGLDALGCVEDHDRGVGRRQHPVGVLGEVAVAGCVEQVHDAVPVRELEHGRGDRDAALLLELHPVRGGRAPTLPRLDRPGAGGQRTAVEQELLGEGGLAGVGVRDDRERAAPSRLRRHPGGVGYGRVHDRPSVPGVQRGPLERNAPFS